MELILNLVIVMWLFMSVMFLISIKLRKIAIVDIAWGLGFLMVTIFSMSYLNNFGHKQILVLILITLWSIRLSVYIFYRNKKRSEDPRYTNMLKHWKDNRSMNIYFRIFMLQGLLLLIISAPIIVVMTSKNSAVGIFDLLAVMLWNVGFYFESISDYQLYLFKNDKSNRDKIMTEGLWRLSRHPNYFGEILMWWAIALFSLQTGIFWIAIIGPILLTFLIIKVSGIPLLEKKYENNKEFKEYKKKTPILIPTKVI